MKALLMILLLFCIVFVAAEHVRPPMCLCAPGQICQQGRCLDYFNARHRRAVSRCSGNSDCPTDTFCNQGQCVGFPFPG